MTNDFSVLSSEREVDTLVQVVSNEIDPLLDMPAHIRTRAASVRRSATLEKMRVSIASEIAPLLTVMRKRSALLDEID